jgi:hypothetical protein
LNSRILDTFGIIQFDRLTRYWSGKECEERIESVDVPYVFIVETKLVYLQGDERKNYPQPWKEQKKESVQLSNLSKLSDNLILPKLNVKKMAFMMMSPLFILKARPAILNSIFAAETSN